ncbi:hypothetical protein ACQUEQ_08680, partial [Enterococcus casseliflavus]
NLSQNVVHSDPDLILHNSSVLIDKEPDFIYKKKRQTLHTKGFDTKKNYLTVTIIDLLDLLP